MNTVSQMEQVAAASQYEAQKAQNTEKKSKVSGKTIGNAKLSETGKKYYEELKKKYSNMDFILVSKDMKEQAKAQAGSYANANRMVVLIDEEKIERMAVDEEYRKQYESVIANAAVKMPQLQSKLANSPGVKSFGMQVNDNGTTSFFAVMDKSMAAQRVRIKKTAERKAEQKKADRKAADKKAAKEALEEKQAENRKKADGSWEEESVTVTASSVEELLQKINDVNYSWMSDFVQTEKEKLVGQHFDFMS